MCHPRKDCLYDSSRASRVESWSDETKDWLLRTVNFFMQDESAEVEADDDDDDDDDDGAGGNRSQSNAGSASGHPEQPTANKVT